MSIIRLVAARALGFGLLTALVIAAGMGTTPW